MEKSGQLAFFDLSVQQLKDGPLATSEYRKATHTDRYLQYSFHHPENQKISVARTLFFRANRITSNNEKKIEEFHQITKTLKNDGFPSSKCNFKKYLQNYSIRKTKKLKRFTSIPYVQGVSEPISRILIQVGIGVALKPHHTLSPLFRKPKDAIDFNTRIIAFLTYLKLPRAVKMTICPIKKKISNNFSFTVSYKYFLTFVVYLVMT